jgi:hypothetical protein
VPFLACQIRESRYLSTFDRREKEPHPIENYRGFVPLRLDFWYWLASGYGERVRQAFLVFILLIELFMVGFLNVDFEPAIKPTRVQSQVETVSQLNDSAELKVIKLGLVEAALYSFNVAILQKPEPKPISWRGKLLVALETVLGPAQAALFALALRRKFMR